MLRNIDIPEPEVMAHIPVNRQLQLLVLGDFNVAASQPASPTVTAEIAFESKSTDSQDPKTSVTNEELPAPAATQTGS